MKNLSEDYRPLMLELERQANWLDNFVSVFLLLYLLDKQACMSIDKLIGALV